MRERHTHRGLGSLIALAALGLAGLVAPGVASAHHDDPGAERGPPPPGAVAADETTFRYKGGLISTEDAARRGLACNTDGAAKTRCYDSEREMDSAEGLQSRATAARAGRRSATARAANHVYSTLRLYQYHAYGGWVLSLERHCNWFDVPSGYENQASSAASGAHTGFLSQLDGGNGWQYTIQAHASIQDLPGQYDNSTNSRARACL